MLETWGQRLLDCMHHTMDAVMAPSKEREPSLQSPEELKTVTTYNTAGRPKERVFKAHKLRGFLTRICRRVAECSTPRDLTWPSLQVKGEGQALGRTITFYLVVTLGMGHTY